MTTSFGEKYRQVYHETISPTYMFKGCTDEEIEQVKKFQTISYIPSVYRDLLRVMGHRGLSDILMGDASWEELKQTKDFFIWFTRISELKAYPQDVLVFYSDLGQSFYFFRTRNKSDDPPVYGYPLFVKSESRLGKLSESLSEFFLTRLEIYSAFLKTGIEKWEPLAQVYYHVALDEFCEVEK